MKNSRGASFPSSNLMSYVTIIWASKALTSLVAKNRPGLITKYVRSYIRLINSKHKFSPCVSTQSESQVFARCRDHLVSTCHITCRIAPFTLAELRKAKAVKFVGIRVYAFIFMDSTGWDGDKCTCGNSHTVGKCERAQHETVHDHWGKVARISAIRTWANEKGIQRTDG